jgi:hypothetical protein
MTFFTVLTKKITEDLEISRVTTVGTNSSIVETNHGDFHCETFDYKGNIYESNGIHLMKMAT